MKINIVELNTEAYDYPTRFDESPMITCPKCHHTFLYDLPNHQAITNKHLEFCDGDPYTTLAKIEQWWKQTHI